MRHTYGVVTVRQCIALLALPMVVLIGSGCQPGGPPPPEAYERLGNAICANKTEDLHGIAAQISDPATTDDQRSSLRLAMVTIHRQEIETLKSLTPPSAVRSRAEAMYTSYGDIIRMLNGKRSSSGEAMSMQEATASLNQKLRALALPECARTYNENFPGLTPES